MLAAVLRTSLETIQLFNRFLLTGHKCLPLGKKERGESQKQQDNKRNFW